MLNPPSGCRFRTRCPQATARCRSEDAVLVEGAGGRSVASYQRGGAG